MTPFDVVHVTYSHFPEDPRVRREVLALSLAGYRVAVIAIALGDTMGESQWNDITVVRIAGTRRRGTFGHYVMKYGSFLVRSWKVIRRDARFREAATIHIHSLPDFLVFAAQPARAYGARVILDLHEILPEFAASKFAALGSRFMHWLGLRIEMASRRFADATITVNRPIEQLLERRRAAIDERIVVLHNAPDTSDFGPLLDPQPRGELGTLHTVYHGTLTRLYGLDLAIVAVNTLRSARMWVTLDIFGDGPERENLQAMVDALGLGDRVTLHAPVSARVLRERQPSIDAGLIPTRGDLMTKYSLSTKLLEYVHLGIPVVAPSLQTYQRYFGPGTLHYYTPNDSSSLATALAEFRETTGTMRAEQARRAQYVLSEISWETEKPRLLALYAALASDRRANPIGRRPS